MEFRQTPSFHTFFLPKRERKYQRKRFRAAARTPRGHRSCSAPSALEMRGVDYRDVTAALKMKLSRRLWGERRTFSAVAMMFRLRRRRERGVLAVLSCQALLKAPSQTPKVPRLAPHLLGLVLIFVSLKQKLKKKSFVRRMTFFKQRFLYINISEGSISQRIKQNGLAMAKHNPFSSIFNGLPLKIEITPRM